jgi:predicted ester cyclase
VSAEENKKVVNRFNKEFLVGGNTEVLKEIVAENFTNHTASENFSKDVNGLIQFANVFNRAFTGMQIDIHEQISEGDLVATRKTIRAVHTGEIMGHAPTGKKVTINVIDIVRLKDGKYTDHWGRNDIMQVLQSL